MTGISKIKESLGGHQDTTSKTNSAACEDRGAQHHTGHAHHDPEPEAKEATSAAGNFPYWGNLPQDGSNHGHRSEGAGVGSGSAVPHHRQAGGSGVDGGALATGAGAAGAGHHLGGTDRRDQDPVYASTRDAQTSSSQPIGGATSSNTYPRDNTTSNNTHDKTHRREEEALAAGAGAGYLAHRNKDDRRDAQPTSTSGTQNTSTLPSSRRDPGYEATETSREAGSYPNSHSKSDRRREEELLGAGAAAGGAGYLANRHHNKDDQSTGTTSPKRVAFGETTASPATTSGAGVSSGHHNRDPELEAQQATSAAGNYPYGEEHNNSHSHRNEGLAAGAGAAGLAGAGYYGSKRDQQNDAQSYPSRETNTGSGVPSTFGQLDQSNRDADSYGSSSRQPTYGGRGESNRGQVDPYGNNPTQSAGGYNHNNRGQGESYGATPAGTSSTGHRDNHRREEEALGAAGLGAAGYEAKKHHDNNRNTRDESAYPTQTSNTHNSSAALGSEPTAAQLAARQAWNEQNPTSASGDSYPQSRDNNNLRSDLEHAGTGAGLGAGAAGLGSKYGQGRDYENNQGREYENTPGSFPSERNESSPSHQSGLGGSSGLGSSSRESGVLSGAAGGLGGSGHGLSKPVIHQCEQCGHGNDISHYFGGVKGDSSNQRSY